MCIRDRTGADQNRIDGIVRLRIKTGKPRLEIPACAYDIGKMRQYDKKNGQKYHGLKQLFLPHFAVFSPVFPFPRLIIPHFRLPRRTRPTVQRPPYRAALVLPCCTRPIVQHSSYRAALALPCRAAQQIVHPFRVHPFRAVFFQKQGRLLPHCLLYTSRCV